MSDKTRENYYSAGVRKMRREFCRLIESDRESFTACVAEYNRLGVNAFPPIATTGGRLRGVPDFSLVHLLASYRIARESGEKKAVFLMEQAQRAITSGDRFFGVEWRKEETIDSNLKKAIRKEKDDPEFAERVRFVTFSMKQFKKK